MIPSALTALSMIRAIDLSGAAPIVRVPWNDPGIIGRVLDAGALGVVIPMIQSAQAFEEVDAIASTPGVDAIFVGPFDLSIAKVAPLRLKQGFQMVSVVTDINALTATARADLETVRPVASEA